MKYPSKIIRGGIVRVIIIYIGFLLLGTAEAVEMTKGEYGLLPGYCRSQGNVAPNLFKPDSEAQWRNRLGADFSHIHHYCWGLVSLARSYRPDKTGLDRKRHLRLAVSDFLYSIERSTSGFVLLPEMYTKLGEAYLGLSDDRNAATAFNRAWELNASYWPPYVRWAERLLKQGKVGEALVIAEEGKKNAPDSKALDSLIEEIQGNRKAIRK